MTVPEIAKSTEAEVGDFQTLLALLADSRDLALEPDPHLHPADEESTAAELELRLSCF